MLADAVVAFDHVRRTMSLIGEPDRVEQLESALSQPPAAAPVAAGEAGETVIETSRERYMAAVETAREHIAAGDAFQIVPSQRMRRRTAASPFAHLPRPARVNPSPYMFLLDNGDFQLVGSSPEVHVRLDVDGTCELRPIAGTRPRGATPRGRRRAGRRAAGLREGARRAHDAGRPRPETTSAACASPAACGWRGYDGGRALLARHAHRLQRLRHASRRPRRGVAAAGDVPGGDAVGSAQGAGDADHRRAGGPPPRRLRGRGRLLRLRRRHGHLHRHPHHRACATASPTCRPGPGSWPTPTRPTSTRRPEQGGGAGAPPSTEAETGVYGA